MKIENRISEDTSCQSKGGILTLLASGKLSPI